MRDYGILFAKALQVACITGVLKNTPHNGFAADIHSQNGGTSSREVISIQYALLNTGIKIFQQVHGGNDVIVIVIYNVEFLTKSLTL